LFLKKILKIFTFILICFIFVFQSNLVLVLTKFKVMKKVLLLSVIFGFCSVSLFSQKTMHDLKIRNAKAIDYATIQEPAIPAASQQEVVIPDIAPVKSPEGDVVSVIPIGTSGNAFGFFVDGRTASVWTNNDLNMVAFTHRLQTPSTSYIGYDLSKDGGLTWSVNQLNYDPTITGFSPARYPQGGILNFPGNTNPDNAMHTYVAPLLDGSQGTSGSWGGIGYGCKPFAEGSTAWQAALTTTGDERWFLPDAFTITQQGMVYFIDALTDWDGTASTYLGSLTIGTGTYNEGTSELEYTFENYPLAVNPADGINDIEIAFAPDGQTGYISVLSNLEVTLPYTSYHPIFIKTTDGGLSWSDPIEVQLGGPDGLAPVQEFITDEALIAYFDPEPVPPRDEIPYYIGYNQDLSVDAWGNPHISGTCMIADLEAGTIATGTGYIAMFHIWSPDGGTTWQAFKLADLKQFNAEWTGGGSTVSQTNRPQNSTTTDGSIVFFSWLDSDIEEAEDNARPDIYFREFIPYAGENGSHGEEIVNVTLFSPAMWTANWGTMPHYVLSEEIGENSIECTIPFVYQKMTSDDPSLVAQFYYIPDFKRTYVITSTDALPEANIASVSQNFPNPFSEETNINITLLKGSDVGIEIYNLTGQKVFSHNYGFKPSGLFTMTIQPENMPAGVYFYTIEAGSTEVTRKMIVK
jgi:hypothetical protein